MVKLASAIALCAALFTASATAAAAAAAATVQEPKLIPGLGLPTLEELGLTVADLLESDDQIDAAKPTTKKTTSTKKMTSKKTSTKTTKTKTTTSTPTATTTPSCRDIPQYECKVKDATVCVAYLRKIGAMNCTIKGIGQFETVQYGTAKVFLGQPHKGTATTLCKTVAEYTHLIKHACKSDGRVSGQQYVAASNYTAKGYVPSNKDLFVDLLQYNTSSSAAPDTFM